MYSFLQNLHVLLLVALFLSATTSGCNPGASRTAVSGSVQLNGESVQDGQIAFEPVTAGKMEFAIIKGGQYTLPQEFGLVPGEYIVRITADRPTGKKAEENAFLREEDDVSLEIYEQYIPAKFNTASTLRVQVEPGDQQQLDFDLAS